MENDRFESLEEVGWAVGRFCGDFGERRDLGLETGPLSNIGEDASGDVVGETKVLFQVGGIR